MGGGRRGAEEGACGEGEGYVRVEDLDADGVGGGGDVEGWWRAWGRGGHCLGG